VINKTDRELIIKKTEGFSSNDIISYFINKDLTIHSFNEILPSLNEIFIRQVEGTTLARQFEKV
jgi:ABC-2 type transport system ATP-binding protein